MTELRRRLSAILAQAASGADVLILKHNRPWVRLTRAGNGHLRVGARFGRGALRPLFKNATNGRPSKSSWTTAAAVAKGDDESGSIA